MGYASSKLNKGENYYFFGLMYWGEVAAGPQEEKTGSVVPPGLSGAAEGGKTFLNKAYQAMHPISAISGPILMIFVAMWGLLRSRKTMGWLPSP